MAHRTRTSSHGNMKVKQEKTQVTHVRPRTSSQGSKKLPQEEMKLPKEGKKLSQENKKLSKLNRMLSQESMQLSLENIKLKEQLASKLAPLGPVAERHCSAKGTVMVSGGGDYSRRTGETWIVDLTTEEWSRIADCLSACPSLCNFQNTVIACGGMTIGTNDASNLVSSYYSKTSRWYKLASMNRPRCHHTTVNFEDKALYAIGGENSDKKAEVYKADSGTWRVLPYAPIALRKARAILIKQSSNILCFNTEHEGKDKTSAAQFSILTEQWSRLELADIPRSPFISFIQHYDIEQCPSLVIEELGDLVSEVVDVITSAPRSLPGWQCAAELRDHCIIAVCKNKELCVYQNCTDDTWFWKIIGSKGGIYAPAVLEI